VRGAKASGSDTTGDSSTTISFVAVLGEEVVQGGNTTHHALPECAACDHVPAEHCSGILGGRGEWAGVDACGCADGRAAQWQEVWSVGVGRGA